MMVRNVQNLQFVDECRSWVADVWRGACDMLHKGGIIP